jgi:hypothetical protein
VGIYGVLADLMVGLHFLYLVCLLTAGFLALRNLRWLWVHLVVVAWAVFGLLTRAPCPATSLEKWLREQAGQTPYDGPFMNHYVDGVFYPESAKHLVMWLTAAVIVTSWALVAYHYRPRSSLHRARSSTGANASRGGTAARGSSGHSATSRDAQSAHSATRR